MDAWLVALVCGVAVCAVGCSGSVGTGGSGAQSERARGNEDRERAVSGVLDELHEAAAKADAPRYWSCYDAHAVFMGTDANERWTLAEFRAYADPIFAQGKGWTYTSTRRRISIDRTGAVAWFDERLENAKYGVCRGSGVLVIDSGAWKITQYNLSVPIPNDLLPSVAEQIRRMGGG